MASGAVRQQTLTVVTEIPAGRGQDVAAQLPAVQAAFPAFRQLHFARCAILDPMHADGVLLPESLVLSTVIDGERAPHLEELAAHPALQALYAQLGVAAEGLRAHLESKCLTPLCFYNGHPGVSRALIERADALRNQLDAHVQRRLGGGERMTPTPSALVAELQRDRVSEEDRALLCSGRVAKLGAWQRRGRFWSWILASLTPIAALWAGFTLVAFVALRVLHAQAELGAAAVIGAAASVTALALLVLRVRQLETRDAARMDAEKAEAGALAAAFAMAQRERPRLSELGLLQHLDRVTSEEDIDAQRAQNHLTHQAIVKAGPVRLLLLRLAFFVVRMRAKLLDIEGRLGGIPSIHFGRWILIDPGKARRRLLFMSDYDGTWESYLGQFVDLAAPGLTGVWSNTECFPKTKYVALFGGARYEQQFKQWTRLRQVETPVVWSAYPALTVHRIRGDIELCQRWLEPMDTPHAQSWLELLQPPPRVALEDRRAPG